MFYNKRYLNKIKNTYFNIVTTGPNTFRTYMNLKKYKEVSNETNTKTKA